MTRVERMDRLMIAQIVPEVRTYSNKKRTRANWPTSSFTAVECATIRFVREWACEYDVRITQARIESLAIKAFDSGFPNHFHCRLKNWFDYFVEHARKSSAATAANDAADLANRAFLLLEIDRGKSWRHAQIIYGCLLNRDIRKYLTAGG